MQYWEAHNHNLDTLKNLALETSELLVLSLELLFKSTLNIDHFNGCWKHLYKNIPDGPPTQTCKKTFFLHQHYLSKKYVTQKSA